MRSPLYPTSMASMASMVHVTPEDQKKQTGVVGIIMRTKDRPLLLVRAIQSVLNQKYTDWHLYLVNDCGDKEALDRTLVDFLAALGSRVTVFNRIASSGMESASNEALFRASQNDTEFLVIHDDDDSWHPQFLQETVTFLRKNKEYAGVVTQSYLVYEKIKKTLVFEENRVPGFVPNDRIRLGDMCLTNMFPPICFVIRMSVVKRIGEFNESLPVLGDWDYALRVLLIGDIGVIPKMLAYYHHRRDSLDQYSNTVIEGVKKHEHHTDLFVNSLLRQLLQENPGYAGLIHLIQKRLKEQDSRSAATEKRLQDIINDLRQYQTTVLHQELLTANHNSRRALELLERLTTPWYTKFWRSVCSAFMTKEKKSKDK